MWDIKYLDSKGNVGEVISYKNKYEFEKEIHDSLEIGRPIQIKDNSNEEELGK